MSELHDLLSVQSSDELLQRLAELSKGIGFDTVSAMVVVDRPDSTPEFFGLDNMPASYKEVFANAKLNGVDPVMQHCKTSMLPLAWDRTTYEQHGRGDKWEMQAPHGIRAGVAMAMHLANGRHFFLGLDRHDDLPKDQAELRRLMGDTTLLAAFAQEVCSRVLLSEGRRTELIGIDPLPSDRIKLSKRELEALHWSAAGKTNWEIGVIMSISEATVVAHLKSIMNKLDCVSRVQAVARAFRLGMIS